MQLASTSSRAAARALRRGGGNACSRRLQRRTSPLFRWPARRLQRPRPRGDGGPRAFSSIRRTPGNTKTTRPCCWPMACTMPASVAAGIVRRGRSCCTGHKDERWAEMRALAGKHSVCCAKMRRHVSSATCPRRSSGDCGKRRVRWCFHRCTRDSAFRFWKRWQHDRSHHLTSRDGLAAGG